MWSLWARPKVITLTDGFYLVIYSKWGYWTLITTSGWQHRPAAFTVSFLGQLYPQKSFSKWTEKVIAYFQNGLTFWHLNLIAGLSRVAGRSNPRLTEKSSLNDLIVGAVKHLSLFAKSVINVGCGDALLKLIDSIQNCFQLDSDVDSIRKSMNEMAKSFLETEWRAVDGNVEKAPSSTGISNRFSTSICRQTIDFWKLSQVLFKLKS